MIRNLRRNIASFFSELARCSPACGIFQTRENQQVFEIMQQFLSAQINIFDSASHADLATLQEYVPILVKFLHATILKTKKLPKLASIISCQNWQML